MFEIRIQEKVDRNMKLQISIAKLQKEIENLNKTMSKQFLDAPSVSQ